VSYTIGSYIWTNLGSILLRRQVNISKAINPLAQTVGAKVITYKITPLGLKPRINSHLLRVDSFLNFTSSESNFKSLGPSNIVIIFLLKTANYFNRPLVKRSPLNNYTFDLCFLLSFHARYIRDSFSTRISS